MIRISKARFEAIIKSAAILSSSDLDENMILTKIMDEAVKLLNAEAGSVFLVNKDLKLIEMKIATNLDAESAKKIKIPLGAGFVGYAIENDRLLNNNDVTKDGRFYNKIDSITGKKTNSILTIPIKINNEIVGAAQVINKSSGEKFTKEDELVLIEFTRFANITLERASQQRKILEKNRIDAEIDMAVSIQNQLLPARQLLLNDFSFKGFYKPARYIGGDYFDYIKISREQVIFLIADVTGKGLNASLIMASLRAYLYALLEFTTDLEEIVSRLNKYFYSKSPEEKQVTLFIGDINTVSGKFTYINCGHEKPVLVRKNKSFIKMETTGTIIGAFENSSFTTSREEICKGDFLFLFTDGVVDVFNNRNIRFDNKRLIRLITGEKQTPDKLFQKIPAVLSRYSGDEEQADDITFLFIEKK